MCVHIIRFATSGSHADTSNRRTRDLSWSRSTHTVLCLYMARMLFNVRYDVGSCHRDNLRLTNP